MDIGTRIQNLRKKQNMTQEELAEQLDVTRQVISKWECGQSVPGAEMVVQLGNVFGVTTDYLLGVRNEKEFLTSDLSQELLETEPKTTNGGESNLSKISEEDHASKIQRSRKLSLWIAFAFALVAFILAWDSIVELGKITRTGSIGLVPGVRVGILVILMLIIRISMLVRKRWSFKVHEFIISYLTFFFGIAAGVWDIYLIWFPLQTVVASQAWSVFIIMVVCSYVAVITAIVFGVIIGIRLLVWYLKKKKH